MQGDMLTRQIVDNLFGGGIAALRQNGGVVSQRVDLVAQFEGAFERRLLIQQDGRIIETLAHELNRLEQHRREKAQRQERQAGLERWLARARWHRVAYRVLLVGAALDGLSPCRCIMAINV